MKAKINLGVKTLEIDLSKPLDISIPIRGNDGNVSAWGVSPPTISPYVNDDFVGSVTAGAAINFNDISFNPHAHGTHTECLGHITEDFYSVNDILKQFFFYAKLISVKPESKDDDHIITKRMLHSALRDRECEALIIRTLPNKQEKRSRNYYDTNPAFLSQAATQFLVDRGVKHLLIDLPSVDKEKDDGKLVAHKAFWGLEAYPEKKTTSIRKQATITELIFVDNNIQDGDYILNLQTAAFENDATPSRPVLYQISPK